MKKKILIGVLVVSLIMPVFTSCSTVGGETSTTLNENIVIDDSEAKALQKEEYNRFIQHISKPEKILDINGEHVEGEDFYVEVLDFILENFPKEINYTEEIYDEIKTKYKIIYADDFELNMENLTSAFTFNQLIIDLDGYIFLRNPDMYLCIGSLNI